ncbi:hypothetical protein SS50377_25630 [Spironucleus salmonicida]|uniref:Uncharacterized protein n=1 Tax=Spironucleus salmonicida TaxID=348837 RepID=V6LY26_9EUKA|nr:hypothetical protein SS50377_25630 [Spironucleus salmonicida]|eukprot:EST49470.1 Hypothetical protein SS50377_10219 [Spironucleus salmonicida]
MYSAMCNFNTSKGISKNQSDFYQLQILLYGQEDIFYNSNTVILANTQFQGVIEFAFQSTFINPLFIAKLTLIDVIDGMNHHWQHSYFLQTNTVSLSKSTQQQLTLKCNKLEIIITTVITELKFNFYFTFPFLEFNAPSILLPESKQQLWNYLTLEIQSDMMWFQMFLPDRGATLQSVYFPPSEEILIKLSLQFNFDGNLQKTPIFAAKILCERPFCKTATFQITEISPRYPPQFYSLIDNLLANLHTKKSEFKDSKGGGVSCKFFTNTIGFLQRYVLDKNKNQTENNLKRFVANQPIYQTQIEKLAKTFTQQNAIIDNLDCQKYEDFNVENSSFTVIMQVINKIESPKMSYGQFLDTSTEYASFLAAGCQIKKHVHSMVFLSASKFDLNFQLFDVGTGGLAIGKIKNQDVQFQNYENQNFLVKYLASKQHSLLQLAKKGVSCFLAYYSENIYQEEEIKFTSKQMQKSLQSSKSYLSKVLSNQIEFRMYIKDQFYCDEQDIKILEEDVEDMEKQVMGSLNIEILSKYFSEKSKQILFTENKSYILHTYAQARTIRMEFLAEEKHRKEVDAEKEFQRLEILRKQQEEQDRLEFEKLEEERIIKEEEERIIKQQLLNEAEEKRLLEEAKQQAEEQRKLLELQVKQLKKNKGRALIKQPNNKGQLNNKRLPYFLGQPFEPKEVVINPELLKMKCKADERIKQRQDQIAKEMQSNVLKMQQLKIKFEKDMLLYQEKMDTTLVNQIHNTIKLQKIDEDNAIQYIEEQELFLIDQQKIMDSYASNYEKKMLTLQQEQAEQIQQDEENVIGKHTNRVNKLEKALEEMTYQKSLKIKLQLGKIKDNEQGSYEEENIS